MVFQSKGSIEISVLSDLAKAKRLHLLGLMPLISFQPVLLQMHVCRCTFAYGDGNLSNLDMKAQLRMRRLRSSSHVIRKWSRSINIVVKLLFILFCTYVRVTFIFKRL